MYEIQDVNGTIHSGHKDEMIHAFGVMTDPETHYEYDIEKWCTYWDGDLKLVEIIVVYK